MRVLFDRGTRAPLRQVLSGHEVSTAYELGWSTLKNGELLAAAEANAFGVWVTTDGQLKYQQNLASRAIAIVVLSTTSWPRIQNLSTSDRRSRQYRDTRIVRRGTGAVRAEASPSIERTSQRRFAPFGPPLMSNVWTRQRTAHFGNV